MIPVFEPIIGEEEISNVVAAVRAGELSGTFGHFLETFEKEFAQYCGCRYGVAVTSGTTALQLAVAAAGIRPGDEVLVSASTNIATALAVVHNQAIPVPVDSEEETWNLNLDLIDIGRIFQTVERGRKGDEDNIICVERTALRL